jgi:hypothetical protein
VASRFPSSCVVRPGGHVGAIEWFPQFALSTTDPAHATALNVMFRTISNDYTVAPNLARHFRAVGLEDITSQTTVTAADSFDEHRFWQAFVFGQLPMFVHAQVLDAAIAAALAADLEQLSASGQFHASVIIRTRRRDQTHCLTTPWADTGSSSCT